MTPKLAAFLREYQLERQVLCRELGAQLGPDDTVCASIEGVPIDPGVLTHNFARIVKQAGLGRV